MARPGASTNNDEPRRRLVGVAAKVFLFLAVGVGMTALALTVWSFEPSIGTPSPDEAAPIPRERTELVMAGLQTTVEAEGELAPADRRPVATSNGGTVTSVASVGDRLDRSDVVFEVDESPVLALVGDVPMWRTIGDGDVGPDVAQLEENLVAMGYDPGGALTVDDTFTSFTAALVEAWQNDLGVDPTGVVGPDAVVFVPADASVVTVAATTGQSVAPGASILTVAAAPRRLEFPVVAASLPVLVDGFEVSARLPDRSTVDAVIDEVRPDGEGGWVASARPVDDLDPDVSSTDRIPIDVSWSEVTAEEVVTVRANALTRLDSGAYVVELVDGVDDDGYERTRLVEVEVGARAGSTVEVVTDLPPGSVVIAP